MTHCNAHVEDGWAGVSRRTGCLRSRWFGVGVAVAAAMLVSIDAHAQQPWSAPNDAILVTFDKATVGDVVATGVRVAIARPANAPAGYPDSGCSYDQPISIASYSTDSAKQTVILGADADCTLRVKTKTTEAGGVRPLTYYGWIIDHLGFTTDPVTIHLSEKRGYLNFDTNYVDYLFWNYVSTPCWAGGLPVWHVDDCQVNLARYFGPDYVTIVHTGNYHWNAAGVGPDAYVHSIVNQETAWLNGAYYCQSWFSGSWVWDIGQTCQRI